MVEEWARAEAMPSDTEVIHPHMASYVDHRQTGKPGLATGGNALLLGERAAPIGDRGGDFDRGAVPEDDRGRHGPPQDP